MTTPEGTEPRDEGREPAPEDGAAPATTGTEPEPAVPDDDSGAEDGGDDDQQPNPNHEAAKYRRAARDAEAERDALRERLDTQDRATVEQVAGQQLADAGDVWRYGAELDSLRGEDGQLDQDAVQQAVGDLIRERPYLTGTPVDANALLAAQAQRVQRGERPVPVRHVGNSPDPGQGKLGPTAAPQSSEERWQEVLQNKGKR